MARKAADQGNAKAQSNLGVMYYIGEGVPKDDTQAVYWYKKAADQGLADAQYNLGFMYDVEKVFLKIISKQFIGIEKQQIKGLAQNNLEVFLKIISKQFIGIEKQQIKGMQRL